MTESNEIELDIPDIVPAFAELNGVRTQVGICRLDDKGEDIGVEIEFDFEYSRLFGREEDLDLSVYFDGMKVQSVHVFSHELSLESSVSTPDETTVEGEVIDG